MNYVNGVDVSDWQNHPNWSAVKAAGYSFAICKASEGLGNVQTSFPMNRAGVRATGMVFGAYHFLDWTADPSAQARHFLSVYSPAKGDLPPTLDCEACTVNSGAAMAQVSAFIGEVEKHLSGRRMLLYMSASFPADHLQGGSGYSGHPLWLAAYNTDPAPPTLPAWPKPTIWQYSQSGTVPGIDGAADLDRFVGTLDDLKAFVL